MSDVTSKPMSLNDADQGIRYAFNRSDASLTTSGFVTAKVGHKITLAISTTNVTDDTETYSFYDGANLLYTLRIIYTDGTRETMIEAERIA